MRVHFSRTGVTLLLTLAVGMMAACTPKPAEQPPPRKASADGTAAYAAHYPDLWKISDDGPAIPGLDQQMIPQGLAYWKQHDWLIVSAYTEGGGASTLAVVNRASGEAVKRLPINLEDGKPYRGHAGGVAISRENLWVSSEGALYRLPLASLERAADGDPVSFADRFETPVRASFTTYADGVLWVGEFHHLPGYETDPSHRLTNSEPSQYNAWVVGYALDATTDRPSAPTYIFSIPNQVQGMAFSTQSVVLSQSYGRTRESTLTRYSKPDLQGEPHQTVKLDGREIPVWFLDRKVPGYTSLAAPPMAEGVVTDGDDRLYLLFESGASKFKSGVLNPMNRMRTIRLEQWQ